MFFDERIDQRSSEIEGWCLASAFVLRKNKLKLKILGILGRRTIIHKLISLYLQTKHFIKLQELQHY